MASPAHTIEAALAEAPEHIREAWLGTSWIIELVTKETRDGEPFNAKHLGLSPAGDGAHGPAGGCGWGNPRRQT
jgi:hypothetical protein